MRGFDPVAFDALPDAVLVVRGDRLAWANAAAGSLLGAAPDELAGRELRVLLDAADFERLVQMIRAGRRGPIRVVVAGGQHGHRPVDVLVNRLDGADVDILVMTLREVPHSTRIDALLAELDSLAAASGAVIGEDGLVGRIRPLFAALRWTGGLWEVTGETATLRHVFADRVNDRAARLLGRQVAVKQLPVLGSVVRSGRAFILEDQILDSFDGQTARARSEVREVRRALGGGRLGGGAVWVPVASDGRVGHVLTVLASEIGDVDLVAVLLLAQHLGALVELARLRGGLERRPYPMLFGPFAFGSGPGQVVGPDGELPS